jgi:hypothetical protein
LVVVRRVLLDAVVRMPSTGSVISATSMSPSTVTTVLKIVKNIRRKNICCMS